ncbi:hypothetical protein [Burkholderia vietnamiensis]|jgi:hypothetical protein|uniref:hypothetical protein n=1 Tax=Burkholderia vietnamiensis TaxID=60552 RepID=UPI0010414F11|nr:hypothetical protein [Burkholderia vietnamiensis]
MAKNQATKRDKPKLDVDGALQVILSKKSREQVKAERLLPFIGVIDEALAHGWKWSPIVTLIRESGGPSLTKGQAEVLYAELKGRVVDNSSELGQHEQISQLAKAQQERVNEEVIA